MLGFRFMTYDHDLYACGARFVHDLSGAKIAFANEPMAGTPAWTDLVLNWFANAAPEGIVVDTTRPKADLMAEIPFDRPTLAPGLPVQFSRPSTGQRETLRIDQTHWRWPSYDVSHWDMKYWKKALDAPDLLEFLLALECEWRGSNDGEHYCHVMREAAKLLSVSAKAKVVVFSTRKPEARKELTNDIRRLRVKARDKSPWLLIDVPHGDWPQEHEPWCSVVAA